MEATATGNNGPMDKIWEKANELVAQGQQLYQNRNEPTTHLILAEGASTVLKTLTIATSVVLGFPGLVLGFLGGVVVNELKDFDLVAPHIKDAANFFDSLREKSSDSTTQLMKDALILAGTYALPSVAAAAIGARAGLYAAERLHN